MDNTKRKILVVEDNIETQLIFNVYLRELFNLDIAENADKAIELLLQNKYNLLLLDINLPGKLDGNDVLKTVRSNDDLKKLPVIVVTAYALKGDKEKFLLNGATDYLSKPVEKATLLQMVENYTRVH